MDRQSFTYFCAQCKTEYEITANLMLCPKCRDTSLERKPLRGVLKVRLPETLRNSKRPGSTFDIHDYLPVERRYFPPVPVGNTPLVESPNLSASVGFNSLLLKFDGLNPTGSLKDRASYLVSAFARKNGIGKIAVASTGNAASSMAGIAAAAGQEAVIFMPAAAPKAKLVQCLQYGATVVPVRGNYDNAFDLSLQFSSRIRCLSRNTGYNPMTIEGKKTVSFEIANQMRGEKIDYVFVPVGDGVVLSGVVKGFQDLKFIGAIDSMPKVIGVQSEGSAFIHKAFTKGTFDFAYKAHTIADSISVDIARNAYAAVEDLRALSGEVVLVSDDEILGAQKILSAKSGLFCEPSSAASFAGFLKMKDRIPADASVVLLLTGHGLKDVDSATKSVAFPAPVEPNIEAVLKILGERG